MRGGGGESGRGKGEVDRISGGKKTKRRIILCGARGLGKEKQTSEEGAGGTGGVTGKLRKRRGENKPSELYRDAWSLGR